MRTAISLSLMIALCITGCTSSADELRDFTSDGCSSFPDGTRQQKNLWHACCVVHDFAYWKGGSSRERKASDKALRACVAEVGAPKIAAMMLAGVRVGGSPWWPTGFRWAYGWPYLRGYTEISADEQQMVMEKLKSAETLLRSEGAIVDSEDDEEGVTENQEPRPGDEG